LTGEDVGGETVRERRAGAGGDGDNLHATSLMSSRIGRMASAGSLWSFAIFGAGSVVSLGVQYLLVRRLGPAQFGAYVLVLAWVNAIALVVKMELDTCATRYVSAYESLGQGRLLHGFVRWAGARVLIASLAASLAGVAALYLLQGSLPSVSLLAAMAGCLVLPLTSVSLFVVNCLQGLKQMREAYLPPQVLRPVLFGVALAALGASVLSAASALMINAAAAAVALLASIALLRRALRTRLQSPPEYVVREWRGTSLQLLPAAMAQLVLSQASDVVIVGAMMGAVEAGKYSLAGQVATIAGYVIGPVATITAPMVAELHAKDDRTGLRTLLRTAARINLALVIPATVVVVLFGRTALALFGEVYADAYPTLILLCAGMLAAALGGNAAFLLTMTGGQRKASVIIGSTALFNLCLSVPLTWRYGAVGAATATLVAGLARHAWMMGAAHQRTGVSLWP
jgi:O-antigen/teichoic acid export membrane protein